MGVELRRRGGAHSRFNAQGVVHWLHGLTGPPATEGLPTLDRNLWLGYASLPPPHQNFLPHHFWVGCPHVISEILWVGKHGTSEHASMLTTFVKLEVK